MTVRFWIVLWVALSSSLVWGQEQHTEGDSSLRDAKQVISNSEKVNERPLAQEVTLDVSGRDGGDGEVPTMKIDGSPHLLVEGGTASLASWSLNNVDAAALEAGCRLAHDFEVLIPAYQSWMVEQPPVASLVLRNQRKAVQSSQVRFAVGHQAGVIRIPDTITLRTRAKMRLAEFADNGELQIGVRLDRRDCYLCVGLGDVRVLRAQATSAKRRERDVLAKSVTVAEEDHYQAATALVGKAWAKYEAKIVSMPNHPLGILLADQQTLVTEFDAEVKRHLHGLERKLGAAPGNAAGHIQAAILSSLVRDVANAREHVSVAAKLDKTHEGILMAVQGEQAFYNVELIQSRKLLVMAAKLDPTNLRVRLLLAQVYEQLDSEVPEELSVNAMEERYPSEQHLSLPWGVVVPPFSKAARELGKDVAGRAPQADEFDAE